MQQKSLIGLIFCLSVLPMTPLAADLLADEQGPTDPGAVATVTANENFLTPTYVAPVSSASSTTAVPSEVDILNEIFGSASSLSAEPRVISEQKTIQHTFSPKTGVKCQEETPLLTSLPPLYQAPVEDAFIEPKKPVFNQTGLADQALAMAGSVSSGIGMPREIRIKFYPNQATFSAQALKWVKSFAVHVVNNPTLLAEIRISSENPQLQEKRLSILIQILKEVGVSAHQVRLYKTGRDENTILMGYVNNPDYTMPGNNKTKERVQKTINW